MGEHEYICIAEIKLEKNMPFENGGQNIYCQIPKIMLIYANYLTFFPTKRCVTDPADI